MNAPILAQTPDWLAVSKPPGVVVIPARQGDPGASLWRTLEAERGERLWVVHRLDRDTSGVVLFARSAEAHRALCLSFERGQVRKRYLALTRGALLAESGTIDAPLHPARRGKMRPARPGEPGALACRTDYRVLGSRPTPIGPVSLVELQPRSGRQHQIRVHLRSVGAPLLVDPLYGGASGVSAEELGLGAELRCDRLTLHASRLEVPVPPDGAWADLAAPLPTDLRLLLEVLELTPP